MRATKKENDSGPKFGEEKVFIKSDDEEMETEGDKKGRGETQEAKKLNCRKKNGGKGTDKGGQERITIVAKR